MTNPIRALIADDEPLARERIRDLLDAEHDIEVIAECADGRSAAQALRQHAPDLLFLDVQMPELDGFSVLEQADMPARLCVIFVTAFDEYALRAFNVHAVDYLLKPYDRDRFQVALRRARTLLAGQEQVDARNQLLTLLHELRAHAPTGTRIPIKTNGRVIFLRPEQIDWLEAADNYVRVHAAADSYLVRDTLNEFEARLDPVRFARIHRSTIVNLDRVKELRPLFHGEYSVLLETGTRLTLSRRYRDRLQHRFGDWL
ncbi:MAG: LytR/AlgR family response regulator transcription factor [Longimicrobiales bacterium]